MCDKRRRRSASLFKTIFVFCDTEGDRNGEEDRDGDGDGDEKENKVQRGETEIVKGRWR